MTTQDPERPPAAPAETQVDPDAQREPEQAPLVALLREAGGRFELDGEAWFLGPDGRIWRETL